VSDAAKKAKKAKNGSYPRNSGQEPFSGRVGALTGRT